MATLLLSALFVLLGTLITVIVSLIGVPDFLPQFGSIYGEFMGYISFGYRYLLFLFGDFAKIYLDAIVGFLTLKYIVLPIVSVVRSVVAHGG